MSEEDKKADKALLKTALDRFKNCADAESEQRKKSLDDLVFLAATPDDPAGQWGDYAVQQRYRDKRPVMVVNRLDQFIQHVSNSMRQNRVSARVFPVDDKGDVATAEVRQGLLRHIEYISSAELAYNTAAFYAVAMGFGFYRLNTEYADPLAFEQEIKIERIENPFNCYLGPHSKPDGSDAEYGFLFTDYTKDEYQAEYGKESGASLEDSRRTGTAFPDGWVSDDIVRVAEYWYTDWQEDMLYQMRDGSTKLRSELPEEDEDLIARDETGAFIERETRIPTVRWCKFNAQEILEKTDWVIPQIPLVKVTGHEMNVDGKRILKGMVRGMKDAQRQYNFMIASETEAIDSSKGQVTMYEGQEEGHEAEWQNANKQQVLRVKAVTVDGKPAPLPTRLPPNMSIPAMTQARLMAADDLKALTSLYDAALGNKSNETSGRGIALRQQQSDTANFHFSDNRTISITHSTRMIVNMQKYVYDTERVVRIIGEDDTHKIAQINKEFEEGGKQKKYDFSVGKYDVICTAGPSFATKRKEASEQLVQLASVDEGLMVTSADIVYKALDVPYAQEIAERRKKTLPPELQDKEDQPEVPPAIQQKLAADAQMIEQLTAAVNKLTDERDAKIPEIESRERIEMAKIDAGKEIEIGKRAEAQWKLDSQEAIAWLKAEIEALKAKAQLDAQAAARAQQASETIESRDSVPA